MLYITEKSLPPTNSVPWVILDINADFIISQLVCANNQASVKFKINYKNSRKNNNTITYPSNMSNINVLANKNSRILGQQDTGSLGNRN